MPSGATVLLGSLVPNLGRRSRFSTGNPGDAGGGDGADGLTSTDEYAEVDEADNGLSIVELSPVMLLRRSVLDLRLLERPVTSR